MTTDADDAFVDRGAAGQAEQGEDIQLVVFEVDGEAYGIDIHRVREIIRVPEVTQVPQTRDYVEGVINLRGGVIPVMDCRRRFDLPEVEGDREARIVVIEMEDQTTGISVDRVSEVLTTGVDAVEPPSSYMSSIDTKYVEGIVSLEERLLILVDLDEVLPAGEREHLAGLGGSLSGAGSA